MKTGTSWIHLDKQPVSVITPVILSIDQWLQQVVLFDRSTSGTHIYCGQSADEWARPAANQPLLLLRYQGLVPQHHELPSGLSHACVSTFILITTAEALVLCHDIMVCVFIIIYTESFAHLKGMCLKEWNYSKYARLHFGANSQSKSFVSDLVDCNAPMLYSCIVAVRWSTPCLTAFLPSS